MLSLNQMSVMWAIQPGKYLLWFTHDDTPTRNFTSFYWVPEVSVSDGGSQIGFIGIHESIDER